MNAEAPRTSYERATAGWDDAHERALCNAIMEAVARASMVTDANIAVLRTGELVSALTTVLATAIALSPSATRSPTAIRKTVDELGKRLRRRLADAEADPVLQDFIRRTFRGTDVGGNA
jgi:hypothetical protein